MLRMFREHRIRPVRPLDGRWEFVTAPERTRRTGLPRRYARRIAVPSCWEMIPGLETYRGKAWFRTTVRSLPGRALRIAFGGVSHTAAVFLDGRRIAAHHDAYTSWDAIAAPPGPGVHELVVEVDNGFGAQSALHMENDYYTYGGITRPVEAQAIPAVFIERIAAVPRHDRSGWALDVRARVRNLGRAPARRMLRIAVAGGMLELGLAVPAGGSRDVAGRLARLNVLPWEPGRPRLYPLVARLLERGRPVDDLIDRVGFRTIGTRGPRLLLNGRSIRLRGFNRHEDHPAHGCALPVSAMKRDLAILRDLGANFIRTSHYPNDTRFLDLCDEQGFLVWEESHARSVSFAHPLFRRQSGASAREMVASHVNRPSIIIWGCLNECDTKTPSGRREHARLLGLLRSLDGSRPVTYAANHAQGDRCHDLADLVSWNRYDAWYGGAPERIAPALAGMLRWLKTRPGPVRHRPVIMSEFGGAALRGVHRPYRARWSEEYQAEILAESLRIYLNHPRLCGAAIWQFCDVRVTPGWWGNRPRLMNNKGVVDEWRRPKRSYAVVKRMFRAAARRR